MTKPLPPSDPTYRCGDVVVVPFPFSDRLAEKRRPAMVISNADLASEGMVWLAMITTAKRSASFSDCHIKDLQGAGLPTPCLVRPSKIAAIEPFRVLRRIGVLAAPEQAQVLARVRSFIGPRAPASSKKLP